MTKKEFVRRMKKVKSKLIVNGGYLLTCVSIEDKVGANAYNKYFDYVNSHLTKYYDNLAYHRNKRLTYDQMLLRRYIILDSFEQEMLQSGEYKEL